MPSILLFDMDGVLIDATRSYAAATRATLRYSLPDANPAWTSAATVDAFKTASGFNNDWHLTAAALELATSGLLPDPHPAHLSSFLRRAREAGPGIVGVRRLIGLPELPLPSTDPMDGATRRFQSAYLGPLLFRQLHPGHEFVPGVADVPLIDTERLLPARERLDSVARRYRCAIATGRPRSEAQYALRAHGIAPLFHALVAHDDVVEAMRGDGRSRFKPSPWPLQESLRALVAAPADALAYIGDLPDDVRAALAAAIPAWGVAHAPEAARMLQDAGAARVFASTDEALSAALSS